MGLVGDYVHWAKRWTDAPHIYHQFVGIYIASVLLGNKVYFPYAGKKLYPNLWVLFLGKPRIFRKSTCIDLGQRIVMNIDPGKIYPSEFSPERILEIFDEVPAGGFFLLEFHNAISSWKKQQNRLIIDDLVYMYDRPQTHYAKFKSIEYVVKDPAISILSSMNYEKFFQVYQKDYLFDFFNRFLLVPFKGGKLTYWDLPPAPTKDDVVEISKRFESLKTIKGVMSLTKEAHKVYSDWYRAYIKIMSYPYKEFPSLGELPVYALKFAMIFQVSKNRLMKIEPDCMENAVRIVNWISEQIKSLSSKSPSVGKMLRTEEKIMELLKEEEKKLILKRDLQRRIKLKKKEFDEIINHLRQIGKIDIRRIRGKEKGENTKMYIELREGR
jgi:hypothetical protein